jgi:hypothetical protein
MTAGANIVDTLTWNNLRDILMTPGALGILAEDEAARNLEGDPSSDLARLSRLIEHETKQQGNFYAALGNTDNAKVQAGILFQISQLETALADHQRERDELQARAEDWQTRQHLYGEVQHWVDRYVVILGLLRLDESEAERKAIRQLIEALGVTVTVSRTLDGALDLHLDLLLFGDAPLPAWDVQLDDAQQIVIQRLQALAPSEPAAADLLATLMLARVAAAQQATPVETLLGTFVNCAASKSRPFKGRTHRRSRSAASPREAVLDTANLH